MADDTGAADIQLRYLRQAADAVDAALPAVAGIEGDSPVGEFRDKAAHLLACVVSVDTMALGGDLPAAWLRPWLARPVPDTPENPFGEQWADPYGAPF